MKTLKEYEQQKAIEKATLNVPETRVRGVTLDKDLKSMLVLSREKKDHIYTKQVAMKFQFFYFHVIFNSQLLN